jgi:hypothetical protein
VSDGSGERESQPGRAGVDYYALLGVPPGASGGAIRAAFRRLAKQWHPDASKAAGTAERFRQIVEAYDVLSDPARRVAYDARHGGGAGGTYGPAGGYAAYGAEVAGSPTAVKGMARATPRRVDAAARQQRPMGAAGETRGTRPGAAPGTARGSGRPGGGTRRTTPAGPVTAVGPISAIGAVSTAGRARRAAAVGSAPAARAVCVECGAPAVGNTGRCAACLRKYGTFQEHLARAAARIRR